MREQTTAKLGAAALLAAGALLCGAGPALADNGGGPGEGTSARSADGPSVLAGHCWKDNDGRNRWWCHNIVGMPVYSHPNTGSTVVGYIGTNPSWFYCNYNTGAPHGGPHSQRYLLTVADNGAEGYVNDNDIIDETDPLWAC